eukprot:Skav203774  [mRNA]  locus=scaffold206:237193:238942:+ [translate_table: standard]
MTEQPGPVEKVHASLRRLQAGHSLVYAGYALDMARSQPAACAALALGRTLALEACEAQRQTLAQLEAGPVGAADGAGVGSGNSWAKPGPSHPAMARARVRRASKEAAEEETQRLRREATQWVLVTR